MTETITDSEASSAGFLSDDEPPQDKPGDLTPLTCDRGGTVYAVKEILSVGTVFDAIVGDTCVVKIRFREVLENGDTYDLDQAIPIQHLDVGDLKKTHPMLVTALEYMKLNECALIRGAKQHPEGYNLKRLQRARRHFATANAAGEQGDLLEKVPDRSCIYIVELLGVERRHTFGEDPAFWKVVLEQAPSWLVPDESSFVTIEVAWCSSYTKMMPEETVTPIPFTLNCDSIPPSLKEALMSMRIDEAALVHWPDETTADQVRAFLADDPSSEDRGLYTAIRLIEFISPRPYRVYDSNCLKAIRRLTGSDEDDAEQEDSSKYFKGIVTLRTLYKKETGRLLQFYSRQGTSPASSGSTVLVQIKADANAEAYLIFTLGRCLAVPFWFHGICQDVLQRQNHVLTWDEVPIPEPDAPVTIDKSFGDLLDPLFTKPTLPLQLISQLTAAVEETVYTEPQDFYYERFWILHSTQEITSFVDELARTRRFPEESSITEWPFYKTKRFRFSVVGTLAKEVEAWQSLPSGVAPTGLCHLTAALNIGEAVGRVGQAAALCSDGEEFIRQFAARIIDDHEMEDLKATERDFRGSSVSELLSGPKVENLAPVLSVVYKSIAAYVEAHLQTRMGLWKKARLNLDKINVETLEPYQRFTKLVVVLKAQTAFKTGNYDECLEYCASLPELSSLKQAAGQKLTRQKQEEKKVFMRMFAT